MPSRSWWRVLRARAIRIVLMAACLLVEHVEAQDAPSPGLNWVRLPGAEACMSAPLLAERVEARVRRAIFVVPARASVTVDGYVAPANGGWDVALDVSNRDGQRLGHRSMHFDGLDCTVIDDAVTLVIAVTLYPNTGLLDVGIPLDPAVAAELDAQFSAEPSDPDPAQLEADNAASVDTPPAASSKTAAPKHTPMGTTADTPPTHGKNRLVLDATAHGGFGQLPTMGFGPSAHVQLTVGPLWPIEIGATLYFTNTARAQTAGNQSSRVSADFDLWLGSLVVCPSEPGAAQYGVWVCAGAEFGRMRVAPHGLRRLAQVEHDFVANVVGRVIWRVPIAGRTHARAAADLSVATQERRYVYETEAGSSTELYRSPRLSLRAEIGIGVTF